MKKIILLVGLLVYIPSLFAIELLGGVRPQFDNGSIILVTAWPLCGAVTIKPKGDEIHLIAQLWQFKDQGPNIYLQDTGGGYIPNAGLRVKYDWAKRKTSEILYYLIKCSKNGQEVRCADVVTLEGIEHNSLCLSINASYSPLGMDKGK